MKRLYLVIIITFLPIFGFTNNWGQIAVAGFVNTSNPIFNNYNINITCSMINTLSKINDSVIKYPLIEESAHKYRFWEQSEFDLNNAIKIARSLNSGTLITGSYAVNDTQIITIHLILYNIQDNQLQFETNYFGSAKNDLTGLSDKMAIQIGEIIKGRKIETGKLILSAEAQNSSYDIYFDGDFAGTLNKQQKIEKFLIAGKKTGIVLKLKPWNLLVITKDITGINNKTEEFFYKPSGRVFIASFSPGNEIRTNGAPAGFTDNKGLALLENLPAEKTNQLQLFANGQMVYSDNLILDDAETRSIIYPIKIVETVDPNKISFNIPVRIAYLGGINGSLGFSLQNIIKI